MTAGPLREVLQSYMKQFPAVELHISNESRHRLMERLNSGALDMVFVVGQAYPGTHLALPLWNEKVVVALPETHRLIGEPTISRNDLRRKWLACAS